MNKWYALAPIIFFVLITVFSFWVFQPENPVPRVSGYGRINR